MADISKIKVPDGTSYNIKDAYKSGIYTVIGTQTATTGTWTGALHGVSALYDGLTIMYYLPWAGSGNATLNLTLDDGTTTGAVNCYYNTGRLTTHYGKGCNIVMTYWSAGSIKVDGTATTDNRWIANANYNTDSDANAMHIRYYNNVLAKEALTAEKIIVGDTDGYRVAASGITFNTSFPILWTNAAVAKNASNYANIYEQIYDRNIANVKSGFSSAANKAIYLIVTISGNIATIDSNILTDTLPSTDDGKVYIRLGKLGAQSTGSNYFIFEPIHPKFWYKNGAVREYITDSATVSGLTVQTAVPANAKFTDTTYTGTGLISINSSNVISTTAEVNQNAFSNIKVGSTTVAADTKTDTVEFVGSNITITPDATNDKVTFSAGTAATKAYTTSVTSGSADLVTSGAVYSAIDALPEPMVFKGSLGTGGTITALPVNGTASIGDTYKVITAGTYASQSAKVGDTFICDSKTSSANTWVLIPSGDEPSGTVTSITIKATSPIAIDSSSAITTSGTRTLSHANSGVTAGTYRSVTVNATGHVTAGTNPTTISGYGITDAKIASGVITLGSNTITPLTASSTLDATKLSGTIPSGCYTNTTYTFANGGTNQFTVTPSGGTAQTVSFTASDSTKLPLAGGTLTGRTVFKNVSMPLSAGKVTSLAAGTTEVFKDGIAISNPATSNDVGWIRVTGTGESDTVMEIATGDDAGAGEQIVVRQYNTSTAIVREAKLFDTSGNTSFPNTVSTGKVQVGGTACTLEYNTTTQSLDFVFA